MSYIPDFDEMDKLAEIAAKAKQQIKVLERMESMYAAIFIRKAVTNKDYWIGGRPPTQVRLEKVYAKIGFTDTDYQQFLQLANEIGDAYKVWEECTQKLQTHRDRISVFQTQSANKRFSHV